MQEIADACLRLERFGVRSACAFRDVATRADAELPSGSAVGGCTVLLGKRLKEFPVSVCCLLFSLVLYDVDKHESVASDCEFTGHSLLNST